MEEYFKNIENEINNIFNKKTKQYKIQDALLSSENIRSHLLISLHIKQLQMKFGIIWQKAIGKYKRFIDLGNGKIFDVINHERKIIMEIKNRYNTDNSTSRNANYSKLALFKKNHPDYTCVYAVINDKTLNGTEYFIEHDKQQIKYCSGKKLMKYVFGDDDELVYSFIKKIVDKNMDKFISSNLNNIHRDI